MIELFNMDCMEAMLKMKDKEYDLAICDPPYSGAGNDEWLNKDRGRFGGGSRFDKYKIERTGGTWAEKYGKEIRHWDIAPDAKYFNELFRISKNQIIWGANYFKNIPPHRCFIVWRKLTISENFSMAMAEYAYCSFNENAKVFEYQPQDTKRFHPTQKPIKLYEWLLLNYAKKGDKILDTHGGSMSIAIACHNLGFDLTLFELDKDYFEAGKKRLEEHQKQERMFGLL